MTYAPDPDAPFDLHQPGHLPSGPDMRTLAVRHQLIGAKGGQGTTTVALALAALVAEHGPTAVRSTRPGDLAALAGVVPGDAPGSLGPQLRIVGPDDAALGAVLIEDLGRLDELDASWSGPSARGTRRWLVLRGPCYLGLRSAVEAPWRPHGVVLVAEAGRALDSRDVASVLGVEVVATVQVDADVARRIDAGLLLAGPHPLRPFRYLARLVAPDLLRLLERDAPPAIPPHPLPAFTDPPPPAALGESSSVPAPVTGAGFVPARPRPPRRRL